MYRLTDIRHYYGTRPVLQVPQMHIRRGERLAVVGASGAGKSTLLRLLNFLEPPTFGTIDFGGQPIPAAVPLEVCRRVTTVFQSPILLNRTVAENVAYGLQLRGIADKALVHEMLHRLNLSQLAKAEASTLSGGEAQRTALARALAVCPEVLLLDEPTANLDPANVGLIESVIRDENERNGTTVVMVTHHLFQARRLAHRVAFLHFGELVEVNDTATLFSSPSDARTAAFISGDEVW